MRLTCLDPSCDRPLFYGTLCRMHYRRAHATCTLCAKPFYCRYLCRECYRSGKRVDVPLCTCGKPIYVSNKCFPCFVGTQCIIAGCDNQRRARNMCQKHYMQLYRKGLDD